MISARGFGKRCADEPHQTPNGDRLDAVAEAHRYHGALTQGMRGSSLIRADAVGGSRKTKAADALIQAHEVEPQSSVGAVVSRVDR